VGQVNQFLAMPRDARECITVQMIKPYRVCCALHAISHLAVPQE